MMKTKLNILRAAVLAAALALTPARAQVNVLCYLGNHNGVPQTNVAVTLTATGGLPQSNSTNLVNNTPRTLNSGATNRRGINQAAKIGTRRATGTPR